MSFDIECAGRKGVFPEPNHDPVIQIANMVIRQGDAEPFIRNIFTLDSCAPIVGSQVLCFDKETLLLKVQVFFISDEGALTFSPLTDTQNPAYSQFLSNTG